MAHNAILMGWMPGVMVLIIRIYNGKEVGYRYWQEHVPIPMLISAAFSAKSLHSFGMMYADVCDALNCPR